MYHLAVLLLQSDISGNDLLFTTGAGVQFKH